MRKTMSLLGPEIDAKPRLPRSLEQITDEAGEIVGIAFHITGDPVPPVRLDLDGIMTPAAALAFVRALREQDARARRTIRRQHRKRFGGPLRLPFRKETA